MTIANSDISYIGKLLRVNSKSSYFKKINNSEPRNLILVRKRQNTKETFSTKNSKEIKQWGCKICSDKSNIFSIL